MIGGDECECAVHVHVLWECPVYDTHSNRDGFIGELDNLLRGVLCDNFNT